MRHLVRAAFVFGVLGLVAGPVLAGPGCGAMKADAKGGCAYSHKGDFAGFGFSEVLTGGNCCAGKTGEYAAAFKTLKVDVLETPDGYMAVASVRDDAQVKTIQRLVGQGWIKVMKSDDVNCKVCVEMKEFVKNGATIDIYNTSNGAVVVARAADKGIVDGLHAFAAKIRPEETQG